MKSFGIGLAMLVAGATLLIEASVLRGLIELGWSFTITFGGGVLQINSINETLVSVAPYVCIGIMAFGVVWYWILEPVLHISR